MKSICYGIVIILVFCTAATRAGNTGKIAGVVKDSQTGEALVGANVTLTGTSMGAATNIDGYYVVLNVPPGKYTMAASAVGYNKKSVTNVSISIDLTTTIDFSMTSVLVEVGEEVVVTAQRPLVQKDLTASTAIVSSEQIASLPVTEVSQVLNLQAGFVAGSLRGGRAGEVAYWIDGVPVTDAYNGSQVVEVNKNLVQELQLISGAYNAEYGQAMSGIVNIATKEGGQKFTGGLGLYFGDYLVSDKELFPGNDKFAPTNIRNFEANVSGPVYGEALTFFANGRYIHFNGWEYGFNRFNPYNVSYFDSANTFHLMRDPGGHADSAAVPLNSSDRWYGQGKLTWHISPAIKMTGNYIYDYTVSRPFNRAYYYDPYGLGWDHNRSNTGIVQLTHILSDRTFYTLGASYFVKKYQYYLYQDLNDLRYVHPILLNTPDSYSFQTGGTDMRHTSRSTTTFLGKIDVSSQISQTHLLKFGVEVRRHYLAYENIQLVPVDSMSSFKYTSSSPFIYTQVLPTSSQSHDMYEHRPLELSAYFQDKMEFKDLIVNVGLRIDYFNPDGQILNNDHPDPKDPLYYTYTVDDPNIYAPIKAANIFWDYNGNGVQDADEPLKTDQDRAAYWYKKAKAKWQVSPRIGFSFPITARGIVHFSYGHFFQIPHYELMYQNPEFKVYPGQYTVAGNTDLSPEQTINGELGVQQALTDDITIDLTAYLRDIRNLTGTRSNLISVFGGSYQYAQFTNSDFGFVKGIVLTVTKRFSAGFNATLDYTYQVAKGTASDPNDAQRAAASGQQPEVQLNPLGWDQRQTLNVTATYSGRRWGGSIIGSYGSGAPYTPRATMDISSLLTNSQLKPSTVNIDVRAYYEIPVDPFRIVAFVRVFNLLDTRNETNPYNDTGRSSFTTDEASAINSNAKQYVNTVHQFYMDPTRYSEPRRVEFGMNLEF